MKRQTHHSDDSWENDPVWKLLDQATPVSASSRFADNTVRAARLLGQPSPWWRRLMVPAPVGTLAAAAAALAFAWTLFVTPDEGSTHPAQQAAHHDFAEIQEIAETEILISAGEQLEDLSDVELVSLIGF